jgi:hypothetical protein
MQVSLTKQAQAVAATLELARLNRSVDPHARISEALVGRGMNGCFSAARPSLPGRVLSIAVRQ